MCARRCFAFSEFRELPVQKVPIFDDLLAIEGPGEETPPGVGAGSVIHPPDSYYYEAEIPQEDLGFVVTQGDGILVGLTYDPEREVWT